jgi:hypothetical protein
MEPAIEGILVLADVTKAAFRRPSVPLRGRGRTPPPVKAQLAHARRPKKPAGGYVRRIFIFGSGPPCFAAVPTPPCVA